MSCFGHAFAVSRLFLCDRPLQFFKLIDKCNDLSLNGKGRNKNTDAADVAAPSTAYHCGNATWTVRIINAGNVTSDDVCFMSGMGLYSGAGNWGSNLGLFHGWSDQIPPGQNRDISVGAYQVWCNALLGTQYIKAEINYSAGCHDINTVGNYAERSITIR